MYLEQYVGWHGAGAGVLGMESRCGGVEELECGSHNTHPYYGPGFGYQHGAILYKSCNLHHQPPVIL